MSDIGQILLETSQNLVLDIGEVIELHPAFFDAVGPQLLCVEDKLQKAMHFNWVLGVDELPEVLWGKFLKSEENHIRKDLVKYLIISIGAHRVALVEFFNKYFKEVLVANTPVKDLLDEGLLVGIFDT